MNLNKCIWNCVKDSVEEIWCFIQYYFFSTIRDFLVPFCGSIGI